MIKSSFRLNKYEIGRLYQRGRTFREGPLLLKIILNHRPDSRFAVIVSKKIAALATVRNRLKRKTFAAINILKATNILVQSFDAAIIFKSLPQESMIEKNILDIFKKVHV